MRTKNREGRMEDNVGCGKLDLVQEGEGWELCAWVACNETWVRSNFYHYP